MELNVPDMTCSGCANAIARALTQLDPAACFEVNLTDKRVTVESSVAPALVVEAIEAAGLHPALAT